MSDLAQLIERLEKATGPDIGLDADIAVACPGRWPCRLSTRRGKYVTIYENGRTGVTWAPAYTHSLDAALRLVPEGWWIELRICKNEGATHAFCHATLEHEGFGEIEKANNAPTPAIALCIAALRARAATGEKG